MRKLTTAFAARIPEQSMEEDENSDQSLDL